MKINNNKAIAPYAKGFTLVEILVVVAIISLLSSIILSAVNGAREKAFNAKSLAEFNTVRATLQAYALENFGYPYPGVVGAYCIGVSKDDCKIPGVTMAGSLESGDGLVIPNFKFQREISTPVGTFKGYVYITCQLAEVQENGKCASNTSRIIVPTTIEIQEYEVGSFKKMVTRDFGNGSGITW